MEDRDGNDWLANNKPAEPVGRTPGPEPPAKRRALTEARREQNRLAQRAYRKRQKEHRKQLKEAESQRYQTRRLRPLLKRCDGASKPTRSFLDTSNHIQESFEVGIELEQGAAQNDISTREGIVQPRQPSPSETGDSVSLLLSSEELFTNDKKLMEETTNTSAELQRHDLQLLPASRPPAKLRPSQHSADSRDELMLPDIYLNMLQFIPVTVAHAVFQNALSMGFDLPTIANCAVDCISPFYQPSLSSTTDSTALLKYGAASTASFKNTSIPIHLRPTLAQVIIPHHASLDLIPIPFLRERAIMLSAAMPDTFNTWELKLDIYERGGLSIWRQKSHSATERRSNNTYQPWDMKSWEAAPWFLKKWTMIIGDEESEFYKQSIGWQLIRDLILSQGDLQLGTGGA